VELGFLRLRRWWRTRERWEIDMIIWEEEEIMAETMEDQTGSNLMEYTEVITFSANLSLVLGGLGRISTKILSDLGEGRGNSPIKGEVHMGKAMGNSITARVEEEELGQGTIPGAEHCICAESHTYKL
jgi:hypothetical protein